MTSNRLDELKAELKQLEMEQEALELQRKIDLLKRDIRNNTCSKCHAHKDTCRCNQVRTCQLCTNIVGPHDRLCMGCAHG